MLIYGAVVATIGFACAIAFRWPAMICIAGLLTVVAFCAYAAEGLPVAQAALNALYSLVLLETSYVLGGFLAGFSIRRVAAKKKNLEA